MVSGKRGSQGRSFAFWGMLVFALFGAQCALAAVSAPRLVRPDPSKRIKNLEFDDDELPPQAVVSGENLKTIVTIEGTYDRSGWTLLWDNKRLVPNDVGKNKFKIKLAIKAKASTLDLLAVGPLGEVERESIGIYFPDYLAFKKQALEKPPKLTYMNAGANFSYITYSEKRKPHYQALVLTGKFAFSRLIFPPRWDFGASTYFTMYPLYKNAPDTARFIGANLRFGYVLPFVQEPWRVVILGGLYYTTMMVDTNKFGFQNMAGPQLFPVFRRALKKGEAVTGYFKFSPVTDGTSLMSLSTREIATGGAYVHTLKNDHPISFTVDYANLQLILGKLKITSTSLSIGAAYGL